MQYKKYTPIAAGIVFLIIAAIGIAKEEPGLYVVCLVLGFMFLFQGLLKVLRKR